MLLLLVQIGNLDNNDILNKILIGTRHDGTILAKTHGEITKEYIFLAIVAMAYR